VIGVVGEIGGGKSQVSAYFAKWGAKVIDADAVGHALLTQRPVRELVLDRFGPSILAPATSTDTDVEEEAEPVIDRRALGTLVFSEPALLADLETILHPRMRTTFEKAIAKAERQGRYKAVVLDAAVLFEAEWDSLCDIVVYVDAPRESRLERLIRTRGWTEAVLEARERAQASPDFKRSQANTILSNTGDLEQLEKEAGRLWQKLLVPSRNLGSTHANRTLEVREEEYPTSRSTVPSPDANVAAPGDPSPPNRRRRMGPTRKSRTRPKRPE